MNWTLPAGYDIKYLQRTVATPLELARKRFPRPSIDDLNEALDNSISFLVVREPFERLLSAYRNKMEDGRNTYYKLLGDQIVKKFRTTPLSKNVSKLTIKFCLKVLWLNCDVEFLGTTRSNISWISWICHTTLQIGWTFWWALESHLSVLYTM